MIGQPEKDVAIHNISQNLAIEAEKYDFEKLEIEYLGLCIAYDKIMMDPIKVQGVTDWPVPHNVMDVQSFLGFTNFY